jgi:hypothetical protein
MNEGVQLFRSNGSPQSWVSVFRCGKSSKSVTMSATHIH